MKKMGFGAAPYYPLPLSHDVKLVTQTDCLTSSDCFFEYANSKTVTLATYGATLGVRFAKYTINSFISVSLNSSVLRLFLLLLLTVKLPSSIFALIKL